MGGRKEQILASKSLFCFSVFQGNTVCFVDGIYVCLVDLVGGLQVVKEQEIECLDNTGRR